LYAIADVPEYGVPEYWILDLNAYQLYMFRDPLQLPVGQRAIASPSHQTYGPSDSILPLATPIATFTVSDFLP
jgi:Uma2 family endonuclease